MNAISKSLYTFKNFKDLTESESDEVLQGRNDPQVRRWMTSDQCITPDEHRRFMEILKSSATESYLRVERAGRFVGVYSLTNIHRKSAVGGFWIGSFARERLLSLSVVFHSLGYVFRNYALEYIHGHQLSNNKSVAKLNTLLGFVRTEAPAELDPRMQYLALQGRDWVQTASCDRKLLRLIETAEKRNED